MFNDMTTLEILKLFAPIIILHFCLMVFSLIKLKTDKVRFLPKLLWTLIIIFINLFGSIIYLTIGRERV